MTELKQAILKHIADVIAHQNNPSGQRKITPAQRRLLLSEDIVIQRDTRFWRVYQHGYLIATAPRRWHSTPTNPKPRELRPIFKERF